MMRLRLFVSISPIAFLLALVPAQEPLPAPAAFLGHPVGADGRLASWERIGAYFRLAAERSDRVDLEELGRSTQGRPFLMALVSSPANLARREAIQAAQSRIARSCDLAEEEAGGLDTPLVLMITCSLHATEVGAAQASLELVHELASSRSPEVARILDRVLLLLVPSFNPDGLDLVVQWHERTRGTPHAGAPLPWLYHPYCGHDNNRDAFMLTQAESRLVTRVLHQEWFPTVYLDMHQMGSRNNRMFVPPYADPINLEIDPLVWSGTGLLGMAMFQALAAAGREGVAWGRTFSASWHGAFNHEVCWKNCLGLLTEVAGCRLADPVEQKRTALWRGGPEPDPEEERRAREEREPGGVQPGPTDVYPRQSYPRPWLGGRWRLADIVACDLAAVRGLLEAAAANREALRRAHAAMGRRAIAAGRKEKPAAWVLPADQRDPWAAWRLAEALQYGGARVARTSASFAAAGREFPAGSWVLPMDQPYRPWLKDLFAVQSYPDPGKVPMGGLPARPYDTVAWTLPLMMGVEAEALEEPAPVPLEEPDPLPPPPPEIGGARAGAAFLLLRPGPASLWMAVNRILAAGGEAWWLTGGAAGRPFPAGTVAVRAPWDDAWLAGTGLRGEAAAGLPAGRRVRLKAPRVGLYQPWRPSMDEGWTRWLLERFGFGCTVLHDADIRKGNLAAGVDAVVLPGDLGAEALLKGVRLRAMPEEYRGGLGEEGLEALRAFAAGGGTLVASGASVALLLERFPLPLKDGLAGAGREGFSCPGSLLGLQIDPAHPIGFGMPAEGAALCQNPPALEPAPGFAATTLRVAARFPLGGLLRSGWIRGEERLAGRIAAAEVTFHRGRVVLFACRPTFRAQAGGTFLLFFNALFQAAAGPEEG